ncbi:unnamed protein product, partial [marine sediment metagenome]
DDGVEFIGGTANTLTNYASISGGDMAIVGSSGAETVHNYGTVTGNVDLDVNSDGGLNAFNNRVGGAFNSGSTVNLGAGNTLTNAGNLSPGGVGAVQTTALVGNLVQTSDGTFTVDLDESGAGADLVTINGTADFSGAVAVNIIDLTSQSGSVVIADATGAVTNAAMVADTPTIDFSLSVLAGTQLVLNWQPASILDLITNPTPNQKATATYLDAINQAGAPPDLQALISAVVNLPNEAAIKAALDRLHPEHYLAQVNDTLHSSLFFLNSLMSCPTAEGAYAVVAEGQCVWAKVGGRTFDQDRTRTNIGGDVDAWNFASGVQVALTDNWRLGFAGSYEQTDIKTNNAASSDGERIEGGVVLKNRWGATTLAAAAFGGYGWFDTHRTIGLAGIGSAKGDHDIGFGGLHTRLAHVFEHSAWYVKPLVDLNATYIDFGDIRETGGGAANLFVRGN